MKIDIDVVFEILEMLKDEKVNCQRRYGKANTEECRNWNLAQIHKIIDIMNMLIEKYNIERSQVYEVE